MKVQSFGRKKGSATLEILIAFVVLTLAMGAVIMVIFGNQSVVVDSELSNEALSKAQKILEDSRRASRQNFSSIVSASSTETSGSILFSKDLSVYDISPCAKELVGRVYWEGSNERSQEVGLITRITSLADALMLGSFCDPFPPTNEWDTPTAFDVLSPSDFAGHGTGVAAGYLNGIRYAFLTTDASSGDNFYVIDTTDPETISSAVDIHSMRVGDNGLNGIALAGNYAYILNDDTTSQLLVVDITDPLDPRHLAYASRTLPNLTNGLPRSIYYYNQKIYIGTQYVPPIGSNDEFHIFNVSDPDNPVPEASISVDRNVNDIVVRNGLAYLAIGSGSTASSTPLRIFDVSNSSSPTYLDLVSEFQGINNWHGTSLYLLGSRLYLGLGRRSPVSSGAEFYILNVPTNVGAASTPTVISSSTLALLPASSASIASIVVQGNLAFLATTVSNAAGSKRLLVLNIATSPPIRLNNCSSSPIPQNATDLVYQDNLLFMSLRDNKAFRIIYDTEDSICP